MLRKMRYKLTDALASYEASLQLGALQKVPYLRQQNLTKKRRMHTKNSGR